MGFGEVAAGALGAVVCIALAVYGWNLRRGRGLSFLAGNQNGYFENPGSPSQLTLGKRMGALLIALAAALAALTAAAVLSPLFGAGDARLPLALATGAVVASFAVAAGAILRAHRRAAKQSRKQEEPRQGGGMDIKTQQRIAFAALVVLQVVIQATLVIAIATKSP